MPEGDGAAVDVDLRPIPAVLGQCVAVGQHLGGKGLIQLDQVHIGEPPADLL